MNKVSDGEWRIIYRAWMREAQDALEGNTDSMEMEFCISCALNIWMHLECTYEHCSSGCI